MPATAHSGPTTQQASRGEPLPAPTDGATSKRDLTSWWKQFKKNSRKEEEKAAPVAPPTGIFGVPLQQSIRYANVAISLFDENGKSFTYGYVPIVVAKCGVFLKEKATDVEGIFRLAGAERRIKELQNIFNSPDRYGKGLDWTGYTVHDAANILRRYLNQLPETIVPFDFYHRFREPLKGHQADAVGEMDLQEPSTGGFDSQKAIKTYQQLITELPPLNRQLLLYILDLLAVFASKSDVNRMTASNLSAIFQPGLLAVREHDMAPKEYRWSQDVLIFLIENQDHFLVGMQGTAADEKTIQDVQSASSLHKSSTSSMSNSTRQKVGVGRSASNASGGADSARRYGGLRRNVSTSSRRSRQSNHTSSPVTPPPDSPYSASGKINSVQRSNTLPSKKSPSPALGTMPGRFQRDRSPMSTSPVLMGPVVQGISEAHAEPDMDQGAGLTGAVPDLLTEPSNNPPPSAYKQPKKQTNERLSPHLRPVSSRRAPSADTQLKMDMPAPIIGVPSPSGTPSRERTLSHLFKQSPTADAERQGRRPNKLQKRRPDTGALGTRDSNASLSGASHPPSPAHAPYMTSPRLSSTVTDAQRLDSSAQILDQVNEHFELAPEEAQQPLANDEGQVRGSDMSEAVARPEPNPNRHYQALKDMPNRDSAATIKPAKKSPTNSMTSRSTGNGYTSTDNGEEAEGTERKEKKHHRWRLSTSARKEAKEAKEVRESRSGQTLQSTTMDSSVGAERSRSSMGSAERPRKSFTDDSAQSAAQASSSVESDVKGDGVERKSGPIGWFKGKLAERKERAKSPPPVSRSGSEAATLSLGAVAAGDGLQQSKRHSTEAPREEKQETLL